MSDRVIQTIVTSCLRCPFFDDDSHPQYCENSQRSFTELFREGHKIPEWCELPKDWE